MFGVKQQKEQQIFPLDIQNDLIQVLIQEADAINYLIQNFPKQAMTLVELIVQTKGHVVFCGMGKSGLVARKLVATFTSIGTPSIFLHPAEALHGDLGMVQSQDLFIAISKSGSGNELEQIIPLLKSRGNVTCLISCSNGILNQFVDLSVILPFKKEAGEMNLAPTSSSTLTIAFGDALAIVVSKLKGFGKNDFAKFHPAGSLGKRLLLKVSSMMYKESELPFVKTKTKFTDLVIEITQKKLGLAIVVDDNKKLLGIVTDGDLRRAYKFGPQIFEKTAEEIMTLNPKTILPSLLAYDALQIMESFNITSLVVAMDEKVVGLLHIHDLVKAGL